jgi:hypothetical protein
MAGMDGRRYVLSGGGEEDVTDPTCEISPPAPGVRLLIRSGSGTVGDAGDSMNRSSLGVGALPARLVLAGIVN